jgi:histidinol-phosphate/aromatic aminotransferase/cobyric acid decarboxylase-like protein
MVCVDNHMNIVHFVPKQAFKYSEIDSYYKTVNIYKLSKEFSIHKYVPFLDAYSKALGNNEYYEQVLRVITMIDQAEMKALPIGDEKWYEIDDVQDLDIAETIFADNEDIVRKYSMRYGGFWRFPQLLDFCYLVNPFFPPKKMIDEMQSSFTTLLTQYPSGMNVNSMLAGKFFDVKPKYIVVGNGAAELIRGLMNDDRGKLGVIYPTFEEYPNRHKGQIVAFQPSNSDLKYNADDIEDYFSDKDISSLLLINPDNPSGNFICVEDVLRLAAWAKQKGVLLIVDESFVDFTSHFKDNSLLHNEILETYENLVVMKSISKSYGVPGLRLGVMASANSSLVEVIKRDVSIWNINSFAEYYMQISGKYANDYANACEAFIRERERFHNNLSTVSFLRVIPSQANFFLCELNGKMTAHELTFLLLKKYSILIKDCTTKTGLGQRQYVRIAIRNMQDNDKLVNALLEIDNKKTE